MPAGDYIIGRGRKASSPLGTTAFVGLRTLDIPLQYSILAHGTGGSIIKLLGSHVFSQGPSSNTGYAFIDNLQLSPYRLVLLGMTVAASLKHAFWKIAIGEEEMSVGGAVGVGVFNTVVNTINNFLFIAYATSPAADRGEGPHWTGFPSAPLVIGGTLFTVGILTETLAEVQRSTFKHRAGNQSKPYTGGLFGLARHINYFGYTLWRSGFALAAGGWIWGSAVAAFFVWDFSSRAVPTLDKYCANRYADMWHDYKKKTPYVLIPYVY